MARLVNTAGITVFEGEIEGLVAGAPFGLSIPIQETPGAGTYTVTVPVAQGGVLMSAMAALAVPWDADSAVFTLGRTGTLDAYMGGVSTEYDASSAAGSIPVDPTDGGGGGFQSVGRITPNGQPNSPPEYPPLSLGSDGLGQLYPAATEIVARVVATGAGGAAGLLYLVLFGIGLTGAAAVKT